MAVTQTTLTGRGTLTDLEEEEEQRKRTQPAPTTSAAQPNTTMGQQTRGPGGVRLDQQATPAGKELIGMRAGVPIYADASAPSSAQTTQPAQPAPQQPAQPMAQAASQYSTDPQLAVAQRRMQELSKRRDQEFQNKPDITNSSTTPRTTSFFNSREYAQQFQAAQAAANQRAIDRIGAPRQDRATSTTATSNAAASALRNAAAQPRVATTEQVRAAGFGPEQTKRLMFGVGNKGESVNVTPDYLERLKNRSLRNY